MKKYDIYLDNAATTKMLACVYQAMEPYFCKYYANPSGFGASATHSRRVINCARETIAHIIGAKDSSKIYFTSGATEANNWLIKGYAFGAGVGSHIITTSIEHPSVIEVCRYLESYHGFSVTYLNPTQNGIINIEDLKKAITPQTILISVMFANNETGAMQPIEQIGTIAKEHGIAFHTDAVSAFCHTPINVDKQNIDMLSLSAHKIYGPKGIGAVYIKDSSNIHPLLHGGSQERAARAGTENIAAIVGLDSAAQFVHNHMDSEIERLFAISTFAIDGLLDIGGCSFNGDLNNRLAHICNVSFFDINTENVLVLLDRLGIVVAAGSACSSGTIENSHVLRAMGVQNPSGALRISLGYYNTKSDIHILLKELAPIIKKLRGI